MKQCPNPNCRAHREQWEFEENELYCPVSGDRLVAMGATEVTPAEAVVAPPVVVNRNYIDSYGNARTNSTTVPLVLTILIAIVILVLIALVAPNFFKGSTNNTAAISNSQSANATATAAAANATATALAAIDIPITATALPLPYATASGGAFPATPGGAFPTATIAADAAPIPLAQDGVALIHNVGTVASCTNSALKTNYHPSEHFFVMVQANFGRTQVSEIGALWQIPPNYSAVIDARSDAMSIDNPSPSLKLRDGGMYYVCFQAIPPAPQNVWPVGNYRVNIYINNGALPVTSKDFAVVP